MAESDEWDGLFSCERSINSAIGDGKIRTIAQQIYNRLEEQNLARGSHYILLSQVLTAISDVFVQNSEGSSEVVERILLGFSKYEKNKFWVKIINTITLNALPQFVLLSASIGLSGSSQGVAEHIGLFFATGILVAILNPAIENYLDSRYTFEEAKSILDRVIVELGELGVNVALARQQLGAKTPKTTQTML